MAIQIRIARLVLGLLIGCVIGAAAFAQDQQAPFTKGELLRRLKPVTGQRYEQGDLAGEIVQRGIAFALDAKTLDELRKAGAREFLITALRQAVENATQPEPAPKPEEPVRADQSRLRPPDEAPPPAAAPVLTEEERRAARAVALAKMPLWEQAGVHATDYLEELPNFIVTQFVTRSVRTPDQKDWKDEDKLEIEMSYHEKSGEKFKLLKKNGKETTLSYSNVGGATSTGEFGSVLGALFAEQSRAEFKEVKQETLRGKATTVFEYKVKKGNSDLKITDTTNGRTVTTAYEGTVWIETATARVLRIEQAAVDIQRGFSMTVAESAVDYDWVAIAADLKFLLPISAEVLLGSDSQRFYSRNTIEFRGYRMFASDVKIVP
ncbi:MAG: hypothetical protein HOP19_22385 [Acidobacteria bacterium]|nr:hypothetical protein [Acidobacteriota bacterium]